MTNCTLAPSDKKAYGIEMGEILVKDYGKKKFYSPDEVNKASSQSKYSVDWHCWAMSLYSSPSDFKTYHDSIGEVCDYKSMKSDMVSAITDGASDSWFDMDLSWLEWPDIELPSIFDFLDF